MVGLDPDSVVIMPDVMPEDVFQPIVENSYDISNRPEMNLLEYQLKASELQVKMKRGEYLPTLGAALGYNWLGNIQMKGSFNISQLGSIPLDPPLAGEIDNKIDKKIPMLMVSLSVPISKWWEGSMAPISDLLDAQSKWQQAESNYIEAQTQYLIYKIEYLRVTGQLD